MRRRLRALAGVFIAATGLSGCATIVNDRTQSLSLTAKDATGKSVEHASCTLDNDSGHWAASTPSFVSVQRSGADLMVVCKKEGMADGMLRAVSRAGGAMFGNILFGGVIGAAVDHGNGAGYNYPDDLPVSMGQSVVVYRPQQNTAPPDARHTSSTQKAD